MEKIADALRLDHLTHNHPPAPDADTKDASRPLRCLREIAKTYPDLWPYLDRLRAYREQGKGVMGKPWPGYVFVPFSGINIYLHAKHPDITAAEVAGPAIPTIGAVSAWRATQGIYDFDATMFDELWHTPVTGQLPSKLLIHLPEWCCYVRFPRPIHLEQTMRAEPPYTLWLMYGFFVHLEYDEPSGETEIRFLMDCHVDQHNLLIPQGLALADITLEEACQVSINLSLRRQRELGKNDEEITNLQIFRQYLAELNAPLISLTLYLCTVSAEMRSGNLTRPTKPVVTKTKKGPRLFPPQQPRIWAVAERLGAALRLATTAANTEPNIPGAGRSGPRAHIRRAHWHTYRVGPGRGEVRVYWLHPILVAAPTPDAIIPTSRSVE